MTRNRNVCLKRFSCDVSIKYLQEYWQYKKQLNIYSSSRDQPPGPRGDVSRSVRRPQARRARGRARPAGRPLRRFTMTRENAMPRDSEGLPLALEHVTSGGRYHPIDEIGVDSGIDICQRHPSYVMQDSRCISEVAVDRVPARNPLRYHRRRDTMAPACMERPGERRVHVGP